MKHPHTWVAALRDGIPTPANGGRCRPTVTPLRSVMPITMVLALVMLAAPARAWDETPEHQHGWDLWTIRAAGTHLWGSWPATRGAESVWVPYSQTSLDLELEVEAFDGNGPGYASILGGAFGLRGWARIGGILDRPIEQPAGIDVNIREYQMWMNVSLGGGPMMRIYRERGLILAAHVSVDAHIFRPAALSDGALVFYGGLRFVWQPDEVRVQVGYDFAPFWFGLDRLEHRVSAAAGFRLPGSSVGLGARATFIAGQDRLPDGGLDDFGLTLAAELLL